jgi:transcriptional regulator with XRE-family HTH domain
MNDQSTKASANQLVAHNLRRAREENGWTQEQAAQRLEEWLGVRWSKTSYSNAERSAETNRAREFTANELLAFSQTFQHPVGWFFEPPDDGLPIWVFCGRRFGDATRNIGRGGLLEAAHGSDVFNKSLARTLRGAADALDPPKEEQ